jgi:hypothetical protein
MSAELTLTGKIYGHEDIVEMVNIAPQVYIRHMRSLLNKIGRYFIGSNKSSKTKGASVKGRSRKARLAFNDKFVDSPKRGLIRGQLIGKKNSLHQPWEDKFINAAINYRLTDSNTLNMKMRAGVIYTNKKKIHELMEFFEQGGTINNSKYMPVPIYDNFRSKFNNFKNQHSIFTSMMRQKKLGLILKGSKVYYIDKSTGKILFVGTKRVTVKKQYDFYGKWNAAQGKITSDFMDAVDNATKKVMEAYS